MAEFPETRYTRDIVLGSVPAGMDAIAASISCDIGALVRGLYPRASGYQVVCQEPPGRDLRLSVCTPGCRTEVVCTAGNNIRYLNGRETRYFSYSVSAESVIPAVERAEKLGRELASWLKLICAVGLCVLLFFALRLLADYLEVSNLGVPAVLFVGAAALGGAIGVAVGELIGSVVAAIATANAYRQSSVQSALATWELLHQGLERVMDMAATAAAAREDDRQLAGEPRRTP